MKVSKKRCNIISWCLIFYAWSNLWRQFDPQICDVNDTHMSAVRSCIGCYNILWNSLFRWKFMPKFRQCPVFFSFFRFWIDIFSFTLILPTSQFKAQLLMTSQIRPRVEYLAPTCNIFVLLLHSNMIVNLALFARFTSIYLYYSVEACFFDHPV